MAHFGREAGHPVAESFSERERFFFRMLAVKAQTGTTPGELIRLLRHGEVLRLLLTNEFDIILSDREHHEFSRGYETYLEGHVLFGEDGSLVTGTRYDFVDIEMKNFLERYGIRGDTKLSAMIKRKLEEYIGQFPN